MQPIFRNIFLMLLLGMFSLISLSVVAQNIPQRNSPPKLVNDFADVLSAEEENQLEQKLVAYDDSTSNQIVVLTIPTIDGFPVEEYALKVLREWGIGNKKTNNGVLILAVMNDRKLRIEVGYGLEGALPDITCKQIIRNNLTPNFKSGNYYQGFLEASNSIIQAAAGEYTAPDDYNNRDKKSPSVGKIILFIIIFLLIAFVKRGRGGGMYSGGGYWGGPTIFGGGGGFGSDSGGFGGFGGGSGGGGGASGDW